ncbi:hypothetical protein BGX26_008157 [Mortierella sp. AD094]|nr:hypothetical protein BGX26_008157 [Mortierella sp. AD094]
MDNASLLSQTRVSFGTELKASSHPCIHVSLDFCKERASIERDYAHRTEALVRKYQLKKEKKNALNHGGLPMSPIEPDFDSGIADGTTTSRAWRTILSDTEALSKDRQQFSEALITRVYDPLKLLSTKKDDARKKNSYVLALQVLNTHRKKYYEEDLPELSNHMQDLDESRIEGLKEIWESYIGLEAKLTADAQSHLDSMVNGVHAIDASVDSAVFVRANKVPWSAPVDHPFESSPTFNDTEELVVDDNARVFLSNKLMKLRRRQAQVTVDINNRLKDMEGLLNLKEAYTSNNSLGDAEEVSENILETGRSITLLQTMTALYDSEINTIVQAVGETGVQNQPHDFKAASFTIPTSCDYCQSTIWGIAKQGFTCRDCGYNCHSKCEMKVPPNCSNVKGGAKAQRNSINIPPATVNTMSSLPPEFAPSATPISELPHRASRVVKESESNMSLNQVQAHVIYDYEATSPGELSVNAGDVVTVVEGDDGSGWVTCRMNGSAPGLIPASYIEIEQFYEAPSKAAPVQKVQALYDYDAQSDLELTIREGDVIILTSTDCSEGWWEGTLRGVTAQFPASYVEML